jgi:hypothetical protein
MFISILIRQFNGLGSFARRTLTISQFHNFSSTRKQNLQKKVLAYSEILGEKPTQQKVNGHLTVSAVLESFEEWERKK